MSYSTGVCLPRPSLHPCGVCLVPGPCEGCPGSISSGGSEVQPALVWCPPWESSTRRGRPKASYPNAFPVACYACKCSGALLALTKILPEAKLRVRSCRKMGLIFHLPAGPGLWFLQEGLFLPETPRWARESVSNKSIIDGSLFLLAISGLPNKRIACLGKKKKNPL